MGKKLLDTFRAGAIQHRNPPGDLACLCCHGVHELLGVRSGLPDIIGESRAAVDACMFHGLILAGHVLAGGLGTAVIPSETTIIIEEVRLVVHCILSTRMYGHPWHDTCAILYWSSLVLHLLGFLQLRLAKRRRLGCIHKALFNGIVILPFPGTCMVI